MIAKNKNNTPPVLPNDESLDNETIEPTGEDLSYNEEEDSFELDANGGQSEYDHPLPYETAAPAGEDQNSTYDEANPYAQHEYQGKDKQWSRELEELDDVFLDGTTQPEDTDEDLNEYEDDLPEAEDEPTDEEGYPIRDNVGGADNPIAGNMEEDHG